MTSSAGRLFSSADFMPHGMCYLWRPDVLALHIGSDLLIAASYVAISATLLYFVARRKDLRFNAVIVCFAVFIVACGATHLLEIWVIWHPDYWLSGAFKAITAAASVPTAVLLVRLLPDALQIPSLAAHRDLDERLRHEIERGRLAAIIDSSDDAIVSKTPAGIITSWNRGAETLFGYSEAEAIGQPAAMLFPPDRIDEEADILTRIGRGERFSSFDSTRLRKDGSRVDVSVTISPIRDASGAIVGASKIARDVTERKRAAAALRDQAVMLDLAQVLVRERGGRILGWSSGSKRLYGFSAGEAVGRISHELFDTRFPQPRELIEAQLTRDGRWEGELVHSRRDGSRIAVAAVWVLARAANGGPERVLESVTDVSERKAVERRLSAQLVRLNLLHGITRAIGERQDLPSIFQAVLGALEEELRIDFSCLCLYEAPDTLVLGGVGSKGARFAEGLGLAAQARLPLAANGLGRCVDGQLVHEPELEAAQVPIARSMVAAGLHSMVAVPLLVEQKLFGVLLVARTAAASFSSGECEFLGQLSEHVALAAHQSQLYGALQAAYQDLRQSQQAVMRQEKLRVLGQMASGIAHDINNALSPAALYIEALIEGDAVPPQERKAYLAIVQRAIEGVAQTVARMKDFYGQRDPQRSRAAVSLNAVAERVIELTRARWATMPQESGVVIEVGTELDCALPIVTGDEGEIRDALTNLVLNAVDAMPAGGRMTVRTQRLGPSSVELSVTDTGIGMDEATQSRCLELFYTTKGVRGTGLGLAMVYGTVERHAGEMQIESAPGAGTTIRLRFPLAASPDTIESDEKGPPPLRPLRILAIDDDPFVLQALRSILERDGHRVHAVDAGAAGIEAFRVAQAAGAGFDAVVTDLGMPGVDGRNVAAAIKAIAPTVPVVLLTGWGQRLQRDADRPPHVDRVLGKPPKLPLLRAALAELTAEALP
jgi:PAS domain S-box-containing protein